MRKPVLGNFLLPAAADDLPEQAVVVADAVAVRGDRQRRHAVHEAGGEAPEAAVAERGVGFDPAQRGEIDAELRQRAVIGSTMPTLVIASNSMRPTRNSSER